MSSLRVRSSPSASAIVDKRFTEFSRSATSSFLSSSLRRCTDFQCRDEWSLSARAAQAGAHTGEQAERAHIKIAMGYRLSRSSPLSSPLLAVPVAALIIHAPCCRPQPGQALLRASHGAWHSSQRHSSTEGNASSQHKV